MAETSLKQMQSFSAEDEPHNNPSKGVVKAKRVKRGRLPPSDGSRHAARDEKSSRGPAAVFLRYLQLLRFRMSPRQTTPAQYLLYAFSLNPINPSDILQIASVLRSLMLPEISVIIKHAIQDLKTIVCEAVQAATRPL